MSQIGEPVRKVEYWPIESPVPQRRTKEEPATAPPTRTPEPKKEPIPA